MQVIKNLKNHFDDPIFDADHSQNAKSAEECFERTSRAIFKFNMAFDDIVLEPIAKGYNKLPSPIRTGTSNFTSNIGTLLSIPNNILQGNVKQLGHSVGSVCGKYYSRYFRLFKSCRKNWFKTIIKRMSGKL